MPNPNQPINGAFGDSFLVRTPYTDRAVNVLYQEQKNREATKAKEAQDLEKEFTNMLPGIRAADAPKLAEYWTDYKTAWKNLQSNPPKSTQENIKAQQDLYRKKATLYTHLNGSKNFGDGEKRIGTALIGDKTGMYKDDAYATYKRGLNTPYDQQLKDIDPQTGKEIVIDWTNPDHLKRHIDTKSVFDAIKTSRGDKKTFTGDRYKENDNDLQFTEETVTRQNNPIDFYNNMKLAAKQNPYNFLNTLPHPTPEEYFNVEKSYNEKMQDPKLKKLWGMTQDLPDDNNLSDAEKLIKYQTMTEYLNPNNQPTIVKKKVSDDNAKRLRSEAMQREMARYRVVNRANPDGTTTPVVDVYSDVYKNVLANPSGAQLSILTATPQRIILDIVREVSGNKFLQQKDVMLKVAPDGRMVATAKGTDIPLSAYDLNTVATKELNAVTGNKDEQKSLKNVNLSTDGKTPIPPTNSLNASDRRKKK